jgi:CRISPR-associated protein Cas5t
MTAAATIGATRTLFLQLDAPFAAFRWLQAGVYRGTFPVMPPSAAWGFALNLAGIETRGSLEEVVTPIRSDAPHLDVAVGVVHPGQRSTLYQQLHGYPVGNSGKELQARARGQKYWIVPVRRELLVGLRCVIGVRGTAAIVDRIPQGLTGALAHERYGLPFAGDNQFLFDRIDVIDGDANARWFVPLGPGETPQESTRLTTRIDRASSSRTQAPLFAPTPTVCPCPSEAWIDVGPGAPSQP